MNKKPKFSIHDAPALSAHEQIAYAKHRERVKAAKERCEQAQWDDWRSKAASHYFRILLAEIDDFVAHDAWYHMRVLIEGEHDELPPIN